MFKRRGRFRKRRKNYRRLPFRHVLVVSFVIFSLLTVVGLWLVNKGIEPTLRAIGETKIENVSTTIINAAINKQIKEEYDSEQFVTKTFNESGDVASATVNSAYINEVATLSTLRANKMLEYAEEGQFENIVLPEDVTIERRPNSTVGMVYYIPLGLATNNPLLSNLGPNIPVRFHIVGNIKSDIKRNVENIGINNTHIGINLNISAEIRVTVPFQTEPKQIQTTYTMVDEVIPHDVPLYYSEGGGEGEPGIMLPPQNQEENDSR
jgi:sporulation protein YunB